MKILMAVCLVALTVAIHAAGLAYVLHRLSHLPGRSRLSFWAGTLFMIRMAWWLIFVHVIEIVVWSLFFWWQECMPDAESSLYFSGVTYTTLGYGDLLLTKEWRLLGPIEGLTGILMCGVSTAFIFAVLNHRLGRWWGNRPNP